MSSRALVIVAIAALLFASTQLGCGTECGPGTVEQNGVCVTVADHGDDPGDEDPGDEDPPPREDPGDGDPGDEDPGDGTPGDEDPGDGDPGDGDPGDGDPGDGDPGDGDPGDGDPGDGDPGDGDPGDGDPGDEDPPDLAGMGAEALAVLNGLRAETCGEGSLALDSTLSLIAGDCATMMSDADDVRACGGTLNDRMGAHGLDDFENIAETYAMHRDVADAIELLMSSESSSEYILNCDFSLTGVGVSLGPDDRTYFIAITYLEP